MNNLRQESLYQKYDIRAPRYTSYPPMPFWNGNMREGQWLDTLRQAFNQRSTLDLYIHIPFCQKLCWYCGCNRVITKSDDKAKSYVEYLLKEFNMYREALPNFKIQSLHFGGGTPNFLEPEVLDMLLKNLSSHFSKTFEGAIEIDPRTCHPDHLDVLAANGFKRVSFGVQDFDEEVQKAINRVQPFRLVKGLCDLARRKGLDHINLDLIWGLPKQSVETVKETIRLVEEISPEQISYYSYAHLPGKLKHQKLIKDEDILQGEQKRALYDTGKRLLEEAGYSEIGMDHYAKKDSVLYKAKKGGLLTRNFMGYTDKKEDILLGLGASSISNCPGGFAQNEKDLPAYQAKLEAGAFPLAAGHENNAEDFLRNEIIQNLMCNMSIEKGEIKKLKDFEAILPRLDEFADDGLIEESAKGWKVTETGKKFVRSVAAVFDEYLAIGGKGSTFSQTV